MQSWRSVSWVVVAGVATAGCHGRADIPVDTTTRSGAIIGGDSRDVTNDTVLPQRGVGWITATQQMGDSILFGRDCTATPITRGVVLTAGHCLCRDKNAGVPASAIVFHLTRRDSFGNVFDVGGGGGIPASDYVTDTLFCDPFQSVIEPANYVPKDLALITLSAQLSVTDVPDLLDVYTLPDFQDRAFNRPQDAGFYSEPIEMVGWATSVPPPAGQTGVKKVATVHKNDLIFDRYKVFQFGIFCAFDFLCTNNAPGIWIHDNLDTVRPANRLLGQPGDSGGPLTFRQFGGTPTIFAVYSIGNEGFGFDFLGGFPAIDSFNSWSPTWDNSGLDNGTFIGTLLDADHDGISDAVDNCAQPRCKSQASCFNPDQADDDGDGVGNTCDNCRAATCTQRGFTAAACRNPSQGDLDRDGVGDVCDFCPAKASSSFEPDANSNGVGDSCDLCSHVAGGGRRACRTTTDCAGRGVCITTDIPGGRCGDGTNRACGGIFLGSACSSCLEIGTWGACSEEADTDTDGDRVGNRCDSCPLIADATLQMNSNLAAETRQGAPALTDACDSTPLFTLRPVVEPASSGNASTRTLFTAFAGVGSDTSVPQPAFAEAPVGFRHCDCTSGQSNDQCLLACRTTRAPFDDPNDPFWKQITTSVAPQLNYSESSLSPPTLNFQFSPIYNGGIDCTDPLPHQTVIVNLANPVPIGVPPQDRDICRVGTSTGRLFSWSTAVDIAAGRVVPFTDRFPSWSGEPRPPQMVQQTRGFMWSHGTIPTAGRAGNRDIAFAGLLRDTYVHVNTPSLSTDVVNIPRILVRNPTPGCLQCYPIISSDWIKPFIQPGIGLNVLRLQPRPFVVYTDCLGSGTACAIRRSTEPHIDLDLVLGADARLAIMDPGRFFVTPVEPAPSNPALAGGIVAISVPQTWSQLDSQIMGIGATSFSTQIDTIATYQTFNEGLPENVQSFGGEGFVPSDRTGARWLFSKLEQAAYMVGGVRDGMPTSEIWRLDLRTVTWRHLFMNTTSAPVAARNVAATAYDADAARLVVIDDSPLSTPRNARVISYDTRAETSRVLATLDLGTFQKVSLTATGANTFVLAGATTTGWTAYRFQISAQNKIQWLGRRTGTGLPLADPVPWQQGPGLFIQNGQDIDTVDLPPTAFTPSGAPPELKTCDQAPVVPAAAPETVSVCNVSALHPPTPTSACGPVSLDVVAPSPLPLGTSTVTWKYTDALGNTVSVPQTVTTVLGDDASCCPAGTNVIVGTPNNDNLVGTEGRDCILGLGAQDTIDGRGGDDFISGGEGDDILRGGAGADQIRGGGGQDQLFGDDGNDELRGEAGDDQCFGGLGNDVMFGGDGQDRLFGEDGDDKLNGETGDDRLSGGPGNDRLDGGPGHNACSGGSGTNQFISCETFF